MEFLWEKPYSLIIYDEVAYYFYHLLNIFAMVLILQLSWGVCWLLNNLPSHVKESWTLEEYKNRIKKLKFTHCTGTFCRWPKIPFYFNLQILLDFIMCFKDCECFHLSDTNLLRTSWERASSLMGGWFLLVCIYSFISVHLFSFYLFWEY